MKKCPTCNRTFADDTLSFCLEDGSLLSPAYDPDTTVAFPQRHGNPSTHDSVVTVVSPNPRYFNTTHKSTTPHLIYAGAGLLSVVIVVVGVVWLNSGSTSPLRSNTNALTPAPTPSQTNTDASVGNAKEPLGNGPISNQAPTTTPLSDVNSPSTVSSKSSVSKAVSNWAENLGSKRLDDHMRLYANQLETYFRRRDVPLTFVRSDVLRLFQKYDSLTIDISNLQISAGSPGGDMVATFDSEFRFVGTKTHTGKVQSELRWRKIDGEWKIVSQRDLRTYFLKR